MIHEGLQRGVLFAPATGSAPLGEITPSAGSGILGVGGASFEAEGVTLYLGDCLEIIPELEGIDAVITDPPYGIGVALGVTSGKSDGGMWAGKKIEGDHSTEVRDRMLELTKDIGTQAIFASHKTAPLPGFPTLLVWDKGAHTGAGNLSVPWKPCFEFVWVKGAWAGQRASGVLRYNAIAGCVGARNDGFRHHPTEKPIDLMASLTSRVQARTVLDPFMGSGTTGIACIRTGRRFVGIESDPAHFATAVQRIRTELAQGVLSLGGGGGSSPKPSAAEKEPND